MRIAPALLFAVIAFVGLVASVVLGVFTAMVSGLGDNVQATSDFHHYTAITFIGSIMSAVLACLLAFRSDNKEE